MNNPDGRYITLDYCIQEVLPVLAVCHGGTRGERRYSSYSYLTSALDGGE
jgi:hypothetical protein